MVLYRYETGAMARSKSSDGYDMESYCNVIICKKHCSSIDATTGCNVPCRQKKTIWNPQRERPCTRMLIAVFFSELGLRLNREELHSQLVLKDIRKETFYGRINETSTDGGTGIYLITSAKQQEVAPSSRKLTSPTLERV
jgi:hypothetical protein